MPKTETTKVGISFYDLTSKMADAEKRIRDQMDPLLKAEGNLIYKETERMHRKHSKYTTITLIYEPSKSPQSDQHHR